MSDEISYQSALQYLCSSVRASTDTRLQKLAAATESPIERMLLIGIIVHSHVLAIFDFGDNFPVQTEHSFFPCIRVETQRQIGSYRVDFLLTVSQNGKQLGRVVVECDGHNFHERTKEQAARDRSRDRELTLAGYVVLRFTGSEIYRSVADCIRDIETACFDIAQGKRS